MKAGIHPDYAPAKITCACGRVTETYSTVGEIHVEICSHCHPFFTGRQKLVDTAGRVERFKAKYGGGSAGTKPKKGKKGKKSAEPTAPETGAAGPASADTEAPEAVAVATEVEQATEDAQVAEDANVAEDRPVAEADATLEEGAEAEVTSDEPAGEDG